MQNSLRAMYKWSHEFEVGESGAQWDLKIHLVIMLWKKYSMLSIISVFEGAMFNMLATYHLLVYSRYKTRYDLKTNDKKLSHCTPSMGHNETESGVQWDNSFKTSIIKID